MKKGHGLKRALPKVSRGELEILSTGALLARLKRLQFCEESADQSDLTPDELASAVDLILFKADPAWQSAHADLKHVLASRGHATRKP